MADVALAITRDRADMEQLLKYVQIVARIAEKN